LRGQLAAVLCASTRPRHLRAVLAEYVAHYNQHRRTGPWTCGLRTAATPGRWPGHSADTTPQGPRRADSRVRTGRM